MFFFIYVLEDKLQWNSWIFKMIDYLKGSIVNFKLNFEKSFRKQMQISMMMTKSDKYQVKHRCV